MRKGAFILIFGLVSVLACQDAHPQISPDKLKRDLLEAVRDDDVEAIERLVKQGAEVNPKDGKLETPLMVACRLGHIEAVRELIQAGANVNATAYGDFTAYEFAAGHPEIQHLLKQAGAKTPETKPEPDLVQQAKIFRKGLEQEKDIQKKLFYALALSDVSEVQKLISAGADVNKPAGGGQAPLYLTGLLANTKMLRLLLAAKANVNAADDHGITPLMMWAIGSRTGTELLLKAGANVKAIDKQGVSVLMYASAGADPDIVEMLLQSGADPNVIDQTGRHALIQTITADDNLYFLAMHPYRSELETVRVLIKGGAKPDPPSGSSALIAAAAEGNAGVVEELIAAKANVEAKDHEGMTPLMRATISHNHALETTQLLLKKGANINAADAHGYTPIILAIMRGGYSGAFHYDDNEQNRENLKAERRRTELVDLLIRQGADIHATAPDGFSALAAAAAQCDEPVITTLLKAGAKVTSFTLQNARQSNCSFPFTSN